MSQDKCINATGKDNKSAATGNQEIEKVKSSTAGGIQKQKSFYASSEDSSRIKESSENSDSNDGKETSAKKKDSADEDKFAAYRAKGVERFTIPERSTMSSPCGHSSFAQSVTSLPTDLARERRLVRTSSDTHLDRSEMIEITVRSMMASFKTFKLNARKTSTVRSLKGFIKARTGIRYLSLTYNSQELRHDSATLASVGMKMKSTIWVLVKPVTGNTDREDYASLVRMSQSLAELRHAIKSLPLVNAGNNFNDSDEDVEVEVFISKEKEHQKMRERMKNLKEKRKNRNVNYSSIAKSTKQNATIQYSLSKVYSEKANPEITSETGVLSETVVTSPLEPSKTESQKEIICAKEIALYFDPPETKQEIKLFQNMYAPPTNQEELKIIQDEIANTRCGICRGKLSPALREIRCLCGRIFCVKHRNPQIHRCNVDLKSVDRDHMKRTFVKATPSLPKSKLD